MFVRGDSVPESDDFTLDQIKGAGFHAQGPFVPHPGLGWSGEHCATETSPQTNTWTGLSAAAAQLAMRKRALLDYQVSWDSAGAWSVCAMLPDGQGTIVADFDSFIGPQERAHAWLALAGTREVTVVPAGRAQGHPAP